MNNVERLTAALQTIGEGEVPILIPVFNLCSYADSMVQQLVSRGVTGIIVCDNASTYPPMMDYLDNLSKSQRVVRFTENLGPRYVAESAEMIDLLPEYFIITDPDLVLNARLPDGFIDKMKDVIHAHNFSIRIGCTHGRTSIGKLKCPTCQPVFPTTYISRHWIQHSVCSKSPRTCMRWRILGME